MADGHSPSAGDPAAVRTLLNRIPVLQRPCDLDLLIFFARHWRALLSSEELARLLGYPIKELARSRDALVAAGLLTRSHDRTRSERMYTFEPNRLDEGVLPAILTFASTPQGRSSLRRALASDRAARPGDNLSMHGHGAAREVRQSPDPSRGKRSRSRQRAQSDESERAH